MAPSDPLLRARELWRGRLIDLTRNNQLLYYRPLKVGTIELPQAAGDLVGRLLAGSEVPLSRLAEGLPPAAAETVDHRLGEIRRKAIENEEERGLKTLYMAVGLATWTPEDGGRPAAAPVVLVPIERSDDRQRIVLHRSGDPEPNLAMIHVLETEFGCAGLGDALEEIDPNEAGAGYADAVDLELGRRAAGIPGFAISRQAVIGNFSFQKMAMVRDLDALGPRMGENVVVAAMAGDMEAVGRLAAQGAPIDPAELDRRGPDEEFAVLPADSSQQLVIAHVVRGDSGVIVGPPGTGKSQTISNVIAELAARGKSVLFVAEKRAALDAVKKRLVSVGLGHVILDLHGTVTKKEIMRQFGEAIAGIERAAAVDTAALHQSFVRSRTALNAHDVRMHTALAPCGLSLFELQGRLLTAPAVADTGITFSGPEFAVLTRELVDQAEEALGELVGLADLVLGQSASPWSRSTVQTPAQAEEAGALATRLSGELLHRLASAMGQCVDELGLPQPSTLLDAWSIGRLAVDLDGLIAAYSPALLEQDLPALAVALGPARRSFLARWNGRYRAAVTQVRALRREAAAPRRLLDEVTVAAAALAAWRQRAGDRPPVRSPSAGALLEALEAFRSCAQALAAHLPLPELDGLALHEVDAVLRPIAQDRLTPLRLARVAELAGRLQQTGFGSVLAAVRARGVPASSWIHALRRAVWASTVTQAQLRDPSLAAFSGRMLDEVASEFRRADDLRTRQSAGRVSRAHAEAAVQTMNANAEQTTFLRRQSQLKTRHKSLRQVMLAAPDAAVALTPCWMASPLAVSQLLGGGQAYFDVVIFDEASQVLPEDAVAALMRGRAAVVAGDPCQLPPTTFFASRTDADADADADAGTMADDVAGFESLLDLLTATFRPWNLEWHYRSKDERLIAFSNEYIYGRSLVTFPGPGLASPVRHVLVDKRTGDADEESSAAEVEAVAGLVREHAHRDAAEGTTRSLGVIAMGIKHARRIEARLEEMRRDDLLLDAFMSRTGDDRFFVKNLERVQGDERQAIILSIGYGKDASGRLPYRFGPLLTQGGERRLNVAITRASHEMTLVSSFSHLDMAPERSGSEGVRLLRAYLEYMAGGGMSLVHETMTAFEENAFERDVADALAAQGIPVVPQYGVSRFRIDMVTRHPRRPGLLVLAIECDGATYHSSPTARDRDRLRQQHLEALGWRFCRIWSTDWFLDRRTELARVVDAHNRRLAELDEGGSPAGVDTPDNVLPMPVAAPDPRADRGVRPPIERGLDIGFYNPADIDRILRWIRGDGRLRTDDQLLEEAMTELGFHRHGTRIDAALRGAIERTRRPAS